jgi:hypothetical protein
MARVLLILSMLLLAAMLAVHHFAGRNQRVQTPAPRALEPATVTVLEGRSEHLRILVRERFVSEERRELAEPVLGAGRMDIVIENHGSEEVLVSLAGAEVSSGGKSARLKKSLEAGTAFGALLEGRWEETLAAGHQRTLSCVTDPPCILELGATGQFAGVALVARSASRQRLEDAGSASIEVMLHESAVR